jgi:hypothetical protein
VFVLVFENDDLKCRMVGLGSGGLVTTCGQVGAFDS